MLLHEMTFAEFVKAMHPSGGLNRWPGPGAHKGVQSYTVFMTGDAAERLPKNLRTQEFSDATVEALTEKLGLNPKSFRDNIRVAEIVAVRHAYMVNVLEASCLGPLTPQIDREYALLSDLLTHPLIREQFAEQRALSNALNPAMADARAKLGVDLTERPAGGSSRGTIVTRTDDFTVQDLGGGVVVAHENRRLMEKPQEGEEVTVTYYKGRGQIIPEKGQEISQPFLDPVSKDVAVLVTSRVTRKSQMVLFSSMATVAEFGREHNLARDFVEQALVLRDEAALAAEQAPSYEDERPRATY